MPSAAHDMAVALVSCTMPPLLAPYAGAYGAPKIDIIEPMLMILPPPAAFMSGCAARLHKNALVRLVSITWFHSASVSWSTDLRTVMPALLTRMSSLPQRWAS